ncbi:prepilin-type N-terminal cleavage/methylation domain-containing protein [Neomoorella humiferrea]|uniref:prepilin-type N-terminal cleavage/methylation domain-containing protein n=1 Tax=Neomoorella humiferrea TaxID=676965 RepID=UPI003D8F515A
MWQRLKKARDQRGFTLVELLVVIAIIGILAAIVAPNAFNAIEKGKVAAAEADYKAIKAAALNFYTDTGFWPMTTYKVGGLDKTWNDEKECFVTGKSSPSENPDGWNGPYLERWPSKNPWGGTYTFKETSDVWKESGGSSDSGKERYLELTSVPDPAFQALQRDLGTDTVQQDSPTSTTVRILISNE